MGNRVHTQTQQYVESLGNSKGSSEDAKNYLYCTGERAWRASLVVGESYIQDSLVIPSESSGHVIRLLGSHIES